MSDADRKVSENLKHVASELNTILSKIAGQDMNFSLIVFQAEENSRMNYISNCRRDDVIQAMKSLLHGWESGMPDIKAHEVN